MNTELHDRIKNLTTLQFLHLLLRIKNHATHIRLFKMRCLTDVELFSMYFCRHYCRLPFNEMHREVFKKDYTQKGTETKKGTGSLFLRGERYQSPFLTSPPFLASLSFLHPPLTLPEIPPFLTPPAMARTSLSPRRAVLPNRRSSP